MKITITHCRYAPRWDSLQTVIREATNDQGEFIKIRRRDGGCDYRNPGVYDLDFKQANKTILPIVLTIKAVGEAP